ncbi:transposase-like protein [Sagittula marina]|uniref:Transposase-like protein n=1 Tax=Sagittula marina TaxID=943940 RepID=A0A7W6DV84_9RHOB|nr:transposase-like protein [Sagittula marina]
MITETEIRHGKGKFTKEFKFEAVKLVTERGVAVAQAARDLDLAESVLRRWMQEASPAPVIAFPDNGQQRADLAEIAVLKKEVAKLKAERDILKRPLHTSRGKRHEVRLHREAPAYLTGQLAVRGSGGVALGLPCVAQSPSQ